MTRENSKESIKMTARWFNSEEAELRRKLIKEYSDKTRDVMRKSLIVSDQILELKIGTKK